MKKSKSTLIEDLISIGLGIVLAVTIIVMFFMAALQYSYRMVPVTQAEIEASEVAGR